MTIPPFNYEYWRDRVRDDWKRAALHWHCHSWRGDGKDYGNEPARRDPASELPPKVVAEWLGKPARAIRRVVTTPDDGITWLRAQWEPVKDQIGPEADTILEEIRFGMALHDLQCGNNVCWGFWLNASSFLHLAIVGTGQPCH